MTPREFNFYISEFFDNKEADIKEARFLAYVTAKLPLMRKFPQTFEKAFGYDEKEGTPQFKKEQKPTDMFAEVMRLNAALGGTVY